MSNGMVLRAVRHVALITIEASVTPEDNSFQAEHTRILSFTYTVRMIIESQESIDPLRGKLVAELGCL